MRRVTFIKIPVVIDTDNESDFKAAKRNIQEYVNYNKMIKLSPSSEKKQMELELDPNCGEFHTRRVRCYIYANQDYDPYCKSDFKKTKETINSLLGKNPTSDNDDIIIEDQAIRISAEKMNEIFNKDNNS